MSQENVEIIRRIYDERHSTSGLDMDERHAELYRIRDGRIMRRQSILHEQEIVALLAAETV